MVTHLLIIPITILTLTVCQLVLGIDWIPSIEIVKSPNFTYEPEFNTQNDLFLMRCPYGLMIIVALNIDYRSDDKCQYKSIDIEQTSDLARVGMLTGSVITSKINNSHGLLDISIRWKNDECSNLTDNEIIYNYLNGNWNCVKSFENLDGYFLVFQRASLGSTPDLNIGFFNSNSERLDSDPSFQDLRSEFWSSLQRACNRPSEINRSAWFLLTAILIIGLLAFSFFNNKWHRFFN